jgi:3-dehydroquinate synthase
LKIDINLNKTVDNSYPVIIGDLPQLVFNKKVAIVTNPTVAGLHLGTLLGKLTATEIYPIIIPDGEEHKHLGTIEYILDRLFEHRFDRSSLLIAFGGGVVGDMTGFTAALYERGIDFIQIPTTLLSAVDASVGGKTGINNRFGKNLIGSFNQPKAVYIDPSFLATLKSRELSAGIAEALKMGVMFDREYFEFLQNADISDTQELLKLISRSVSLKAEVVALDEKEHGVRAVLNYGHTFAHVIENETNYKKYLHGEAVAMGMVMANALAVNLGNMSADEAALVERVLAKFGLPTRYVVKDVDAFYDKFFLDKKTEGAKIKFIVPDGIGGHEIVSGIDENIVKAALAEFATK